MNVKLMILGLLILTLTACGKKKLVDGGYSIGGAVIGLTGTLVLANGDDIITLTSNRSFTFSQNVDIGDSFHIRVVAQPLGQTCLMVNESGVMSANDIRNIEVICAANPIIKMFSAGSYNGNLGGRAGADAKCVAAATSMNLDCPFSVRAFLSVDANDEIRDMPTRYGVPTNSPIRTIVGTNIQDNWSALLSGSLITALQNAGVVSGNYWWAGSNDASGTLSSATCNGWTSSINSDQGRAGYSPSETTTWIGSVQANCANAYEVVCLCF